MSVWEFNAALNGYARAHSAKEGSRLSDAEAADLFAWIEAGNDNAAVRSTTVYDWDGVRLVPVKRVTFKAS